jgi:hypothetical protein
MGQVFFFSFFLSSPSSCSPSPPCVQIKEIETSNRRTREEAKLSVSLGAEIKGQTRKKKKRERWREREKKNGWKVAGFDLLASFPQYFSPLAKSYKTMKNAGNHCTAG